MAYDLFCDPLMCPSCDLLVTFGAPVLMTCVRVRVQVGMLAHVGHVPRF